MIRNDLAVLAAIEGKLDEARTGWQEAVEVDPECLLARLNRDLVEAELSFATIQDDFGELKLAPAPLPSPLVGEGGPEGLMGGQMALPASPTARPSFPARPGHPHPGPPPSRGRGKFAQGGILLSASRW